VTITTILNTVIIFVLFVNETFCPGIYRDSAKMFGKKQLGSVLE